MNQCRLAQLSFSIVVLTAAVAGAAGASGTSSPEADAGWLHGEALMAELDGNLSQALELARQALAASPLDEGVAYDVARLALAAGSPTMDADIAAFLALEAGSPDSSLLRARLLHERGRRDEARAQIERVLSFRPTDGEALRLREEIAPGARAQAGAKNFSARVRVGGQVDSNVTVLAEDDPSRMSASRVTLDAQVAIHRKPRAVRWTAGVAVSGGPYLQDREQLALYEANSATVFGGLERKLAGGQLAMNVGYTDTRVDSFAASFMRHVALDTQLRFGAKPWVFGPYAELSARDFVEANPEDTRNDRDGPRAEVGAMARFRHRALTLGAKAGGYYEAADGRRQEVAGGRGAAQIAVHVGDADLALSASIERRQYQHGGRLDQRLGGGVMLGYDLSEQLGAIASYAFTDSRSATTLDYRRHLGQVGLEARW